MTLAMPLRRVMQPGDREREPAPSGAIVQALTEGDWTLCGACRVRIGLGFAAVRTGARVKCHNRRCGAWVLLPIPAATE